MGIAPGTRFGPYEIVGSLGAGGMGEVYRARDTKLEREVAIKTLPSALASDKDRLARFEREAKLLATLNHAHIGAIYGLDEYEGAQFIVIELVEGETLEEKLKDGPLPVEDALRIALQVAEALEAAHDKGVMHRDLKPANVMLTRDGVVKVLDFGLAKAFSGDPNAASPAHSPALSVAMTQQGLILGTAGYMSPEQASGQATDQRADIWAFGVVLYEMLTGLPLFSGESVPHILADVLRTAPDWKRLPKDIHPRLQLLLERCLEKKPRNRYHSIADVRIEIEKILSDPHGATAAVAVALPAQPIWRRALPAAALVIVAVIITALVTRFTAPTDLREVNRFDYDLPQDQQFRNQGRPILALSPDGRQFVYNATDGLYLRAMSDLEPQLIPGTEPGLTAPTFSPDSQSVAYFGAGGAETGLLRIAIRGGAPVVVTREAINPFGLRWEPDGTLLFGQPGGIYRVPANGGTPERIIETEEGMQAYGPQLLPDGDTVLFSLGPEGDWDAAHVVAQRLSTGERVTLIEGGNDARYLPTGHLVYALGDGLFGVAFDAKTLTVSGGAVPLLQGFLRANVNQTGVAHFSVSDNGTLVYAVGSAPVIERTLVWVDRAGSEMSIGVPPRDYVKPRISPDGTTVALDIRDQQLDLWSWDLARATLTRLTFNPAQDEFPVWSPDGQRIAFSSGGGLSGNLLWQAADGTGSAEQLAQGGGQIFPTSFLPDGSGILVFGTGGGNSNTNDDISLFRFGGEDRGIPLLHTAFAESYPMISPDGRWLAYVSDESGREEVYVRPFPDVDAGRWQVSTSGGTQPMWARNGRELFYRNGRAFVAVAIQTETGFVAGAQRVLFEGDYVLEQGGPNYDVSPDGERFLLIKDLRNTLPPPQIIVVQNWFEELKRLVPSE